MKKCTLALLAVVAAVLSTAAVPVRGQDGTISGKEIQEQWVGKSLVGTTAGGGPAVLRLLADGSASIGSGEATLDTGQWRAWEKGYCTTWATIRRGVERCFTVQRSGTRIAVLNPDGSVSGYFDQIK